VSDALTGLWQLAGHLIAALMWADTPQRAVLLSVAALTVAFLPQRDPDARGRSRPRAPSAARAAA